MTNLSDEQIEILHHTKWRAAKGLYCGAVEDADLKGLVANGYMTMRRSSILPEDDAYFALTGKGSAALRENAHG